jgi:cytochrome P450
LSNINKSAELASKGAGVCGEEFNLFLSRCAFDAFCSVLFGELTQTADQSTPTDPKTLEFLDSIIYITRLSLDTDQFGALSWAYYAKKFGMPTAFGKEVMRRYDSVEGHSKTLVNTFIDKMNRDLLDEHQRNSYLMSALHRSEEGATVSQDELVELCQVLLFTSADTTSAILFSVLVQLTLCPEVQNKLAKLLREELGTGGIEMDHFKSSAGLVYLNAVIRECHRIRPPLGPIVHFKRPVCDLEVHGRNLPKETLVTLDIHSIQNDPALVTDAEKFLPERWLQDAVKARKGTPEAVIDHALLKTPFSSGARQCPAARVANLEVQCILAHLIKDWSFELAEKAHATQLSDFASLPLIPGYILPFPKLIIAPRS